MFNEHLYHGTGKIRGDRMLSNQEMEISRGNSHWLGDGSYFFEEKLYAFKWISDMCRKRYPKEPHDESLIRNYSILEASILTIKERVFDLNKAEHKILFDEVYNLLYEMKKESADLCKSELSEGVVLNYMFESMNFKEKYDIVVAVFLRNTTNYKSINTRLGFMPQKQICVKKQDIVKNIIDVNYREDIASFQQQLSKLNYNAPISHLKTLKRNSKLSENIFQT